MEQPSRREWDFGLMIGTVAVLAALGVQSLAGTTYAWWASRTTPGWEESFQSGYLGTMNTIAAPLVVALVVLLGLCVPKRLLSRAALAVVSGAMLVAGALGWLVLGSATDGLVVYLVVAAVFQLVVVALTAGGTRLAYLTEGRLVHLGSALLHLGFLTFALVAVALQGEPLMLPVFWASFGLLIGGSALSFYAQPLAQRARMHGGDGERSATGESPPEEEAAEQ